METEVKKITTEQLDTLLKQQKDLSDILTNIGILESQKHSFLHRLSEVNKDVEEFKLELEGKYGSINISLQDGSYTEIDKNEKTE